MPTALRPASRIVHQHLLALREAALGLSLAELAAQTGLGIRTVRRAAAELEADARVCFGRRARGERFVSGVTVDQALTGPEAGPSGPSVREIAGPSGPSGPSESENEHPHLYRELTINQAAVVVRGRARERTPGASPGGAAQQQQPLLGLLECVPDREAIAARAMLERLEAVVRASWRRHPSSPPAWLLADERNLAGLRLALRRYEPAEIEAVVAWSVDRVAEGRLGPGMFATSFRGAAFADRHRAWMEEKRAEERRRRQEAAIASDVAAHRAPQQLVLEPEAMAALASQWLEQVAAGGAA